MDDIVGPHDPPDDAKEHPVERDDYLIGTRPIERGINFLRESILGRVHGAGIHGGGRIGKTEFCKYAVRYPDLWLPQPALLYRIIIPRRRSHHDSAFFRMVNTQLKIERPDRPKNGRLDRAVEFLLERCSLTRLKLVIIICDEAQRLVSDEYEYLADLDNFVREGGKKLFIVFVRQRMQVGSDQASIDDLMLSESLIGRFFLENHEFTGLLDVADLAHALARFDENAQWKGRCYSEHFAPKAYRAKWRFEKEAELIHDRVLVARKSWGLPGFGDWPMRSFTLFVNSLFIDVMARNPNFKGLTKEEVDIALNRSRYITLELSRLSMGGVNDVDDEKESRTGKD